MKPAMSAVGAKRPTRNVRARVSSRGRSRLDMLELRFSESDPERTCVPNRTLFDADLMEFREVEILQMTQTGINVRVFPDIHVALPVSRADRWERAAFLESRLPHQRTDTGPRDSGLQRFAPRPESDLRALWRPPVPVNPT
jgi:hypothetical protein